MRSELAPETPAARIERITDLLRRAQGECQAETPRPIEPRTQALLDTVAEILEGIIRALDEEASQSG
jgi:hypothetical protein